MQLYDSNVDIDGSCNEDNHDLTQQDEVTLNEFASMTGIDDDLTQDNYSVARPFDTDNR
jgi:hypothetical protein